MKPIFFACYTTGKCCTFSLPLPYPLLINLFVMKGMAWRLHWNSFDLDWKRKQIDLNLEWGGLLEAELILWVEINPVRIQMCNRQPCRCNCNSAEGCHMHKFGCARIVTELLGSKNLLICFFPLRTGRGDIQPQLDSALQDVNDKYLLLEETEKQAVRKALIEERGRFCAFISMLRPVIVSFISRPSVLCLRESEPT